MTRLAVSLIAGALAATAGVGCSLGGEDGGADKAGGSDPPVVLRLAYPYKQAEGQPDEPLLRYFVSQVEELSDGELRVHPYFNIVGDEVAGVEARLAGMVRRGQFDLGWVATRAWDQLGVTSFQALQAPFLVSDYAILDRVVTGSTADEMLDGLEQLDLTGLALVPDLLRHPAVPAQKRPLVSAGDFAEARIRVFPSDASDALVAALGATPVHVSSGAFGGEISRGRIDGGETSIPRAPGGWTLTANVMLFGKANTLFGNSDALAGLTGEQRAVLRRAAEQTAEHAAQTRSSEAELARRFCSAGQIALASPEQLAELRRAARPVYDRLERDPQTHSLIARIQRVKRSLPPRPAVVEPCDEDRPAPAATEKRLSPNLFNGTYRWQLRKADAERLGLPNDPDVGALFTLTLRDGKWQGGKGPAAIRGTYTATDDQLRFDWPEAGSVLTFSYAGEPGGTLRVKPVLPMDLGDQFNWTGGGPWRRIGSPVETP